MKCSLGVDEWYPMLSVDSVKCVGDEQEVPPRLLDALRRAEKDWERAEREIIRHLQKTNQEYPYSIAEKLGLV